MSSFTFLPRRDSQERELTRNSTISLGKFGTFASNLLLFRPYNLTYELLDRAPGDKDADLRMVPASEIHADVLAEEAAAASSANGSSEIIAGDGVEFQLIGENGEVIMRSNRETIDDSARQTLTMEEIETLKREGTSAGKDLIAKLMLSHTGLDEKTSFSLAKYKLLKTKKYLKRFTILPLDVAMLTQWMMEQKDASKILEIREEMLSLIGSWSNVHFSEDRVSGASGGRWLVVDETGGLLVASMAERMGILHQGDTQPPLKSSPDEATKELDESHHFTELPLAVSNTLTLIHTNAQPNLSLLSYFNYHPNSPTDPSSREHPLAQHLHPLSWLQLVSPSQDTTYANPPTALTSEELLSMKSGKRGTYYRKLRRYNKAKQIIDTTHAGGFDGLAVAASMDPISILKHLIPLLRGGASLAIYSPTIEPLVALTDLYSTSRRTAFIQSPPEELDGLNGEELAKWQGNEDFPLNPTLLLNVSVQSARANEWQVLPGRTHPLMTSRGGAEGYLFTATRVIPAEGKVEARGKWLKKRGDEPSRAGANWGLKKPAVEPMPGTTEKNDVEMAEADS